MFAKEKGRTIISGNLIFNKNKELMILYRKDKKYYEIAGGKVNINECKDLNNISLDDLKRTALRELREEIGEDLQITNPVHFSRTEFSTVDGYDAIINTFVSKIISGKPKICEPERFGEIKFVKVKDLRNNILSPGFKSFIDKLEKEFA